MSLFSACVSVNLSLQDALPIEGSLLWLGMRFRAGLQMAFSLKASLIGSPPSIEAFLDKAF